LTELYIFNDIKGAQSRRRFIRNIHKYIILYRYLWRKVSKNILIRRVIDNPDQQYRILRPIHDKYSYRDKKDIYIKITERYY